MDKEHDRRKFENQDSHDYYYYLVYSADSCINVHAKSILYIFMSLIYTKIKCKIFTFFDDFHFASP